MGLFNLNELSQASDDDVLDLKVESAESGTDAGSDAAPHEYDDGYTKISVPSKTEITADAYNDALAKLKQSFKEAYELMDDLTNARIIQETVESKQEAYLDEMFAEAYDNGPIFEAVERSDKNEVKKIVGEVRKKLPDLASKLGFKFKPPKTFLRLLLNTDYDAYGTGILTKDTSDTKSKYGNTAVTWWSTRFWQVVGVIYTENTNIKKVMEEVNDELKDDLGEYKVLYSMSSATLYDLWNVKFNWKNRKNVFFLIVDKKLPKELKADLNALKPAEDK